MTRLHVTEQELRDLVATHLLSAEVDLGVEILTKHWPDGLEVDALELTRTTLRRRAERLASGQHPLRHHRLLPELAVPAVYGITTASSRWLDLVRLASRDGEDVPLFRAPRWCSQWLGDRIADRLQRLLVGLDLIDARPACKAVSPQAQRLIADIQAGFIRLDPPTSPRES